MTTCPRCGGALTQQATYTPEGALVCPRCAALASIAAANARAQPQAPQVPTGWLRPALLRKHGVAFSIALGAVGLLGAPFAIYQFFALDHGASLVPVAYALVMTGSIWAGVVGASERKPVQRAVLPGGAPPRTGAPSPVAQPSAGTVVAAAAGPAMVATGCGIAAFVIVAVTVVAFAILAWLFWVFFLHGTWNVG
jgi:hypothetical protein